MRPSEAMRPALYDVQASAIDHFGSARTGGSERNDMVVVAMDNEGWHINAFQILAEVLVPGCDTRHARGSALQPERERGSARGSGHHARCDGCSTRVGKLKNGLATGYGKTLELANCFRLWWPGTELNRRRQPFQGCALPPELPGHFPKTAFHRLRAQFASR